MTLLHQLMAAERQRELVRAARELRVSRRPRGGRAVPEPVAARELAVYRAGDPRPARTGPSRPRGV